MASLFHAYSVLFSIHKTLYLDVETFVQVTVVRNFFDLFLTIIFLFDNAKASISLLPGSRNF